MAIPEEQFNELGGEGQKKLETFEQERYIELFSKLVKEDQSNIFLEQLKHVMKEENEDEHFGIYVDSKLLLDDNMVLGHLVMRYPSTLLKLFSKALVLVQEHLLATPAFRENEEEIYSLKQNVHARIQWLPRANRKENISSIRAHDVFSFIQISGTVTRSGPMKVLEAIRVFECSNKKCNGTVKAFASLNELNGLIEMPTGPCPNCKRSSSYTEINVEAVCHDYQEIKIQEQVQKLGMGSIPRNINVLLLHDLVDLVKAGDDVVITGVPIHRWNKTYKEERCYLETVIIANTIHAVNSASDTNALLTDDLVSEFNSYWQDWRQRGKPLQARNQIIGSMCPQLYGLFMVKLAVTLTLIGSPSFTDKRGTRVRGDSHLLLVGDPGTGKSQILRYAAKLAPRSVQTTGCGTTSAGLTCTAVKEGSEYMLEAGALVLADRGVCCIDEFGAIKEHDRATIHEAMEQQTLSVAKAGLVCTLNTRTTIIAVTNPKGSYDVDSDLSTNVGIAAPLLSRFDMVLVLLDSPEEAWDRTVSDHILKSQVNSSETKEDSLQQDEEMGSNPAMGIFNIEKLQAYLTYAKRFEPQLVNGSHAARVLTTFYQTKRNQRTAYGLGSEAGRTTLRLLESLIRIAKAHARLMASNIVKVQDAIVAISIIELSMKMQSAVGNDSVLHKDFPQDPEKEYEATARSILTELRLQDLINLQE